MTLLNSSPLFTTTVTPEQIEAMRAFAYSNVALACKQYVDTNTVCVAQVGVDEKGKANASAPKTWGCHNIIKTGWTTGRDAVFSQTQYPKRGVADKEARLAWANYYVNESPFAPFIWSTAEEYSSTGILVSTDVPANFIANLLIGSRLITSETFSITFNQFVKAGIHPDMAAFLAHQWVVKDGKIYASRSGDHGLFTDSMYIGPGTIWSWVRHKPYYTTPHKYRNNTDGSTYGGVYALWDGVTTSGTEGSTRFTKRHVPDKGLNMEAKLLAYFESLKTKVVEASSLNIFQKALAAIAAHDKNKMRQAVTIDWTTENKRAVADFFNEVYVKAQQLEEADFTTFWNNKKALAL